MQLKIQWGLRFCISGRLPGDARGQDIPLGAALHVVDQGALSALHSGTWHLRNQLLYYKLEPHDFLLLVGDGAQDKLNRNICGRIIN